MTIRERISFACTYNFLTFPQIIRHCSVSGNECTGWPCFDAVVAYELGKLYADGMVKRRDDGKGTLSWMTVPSPKPKPAPKGWDKIETSVEDVADGRPIPDTGGVEPTGTWERDAYPDGRD